MTGEILFDERGGWGVVTLNRPETLNALTWDMVKACRTQLMKWEAAPHVRAVLIRGAGEKAFCAGGDIRWLHDAAQRDPDHACGFFHEEYRLNAAIHHFPKPYVALIDGVVMGGGVGISVHGDFRVAGDRTLFAMPETGIGLFPDVGGGHFMPRLHDGLGLYYALTGARAKAADCMATGVATHYVRTEDMPELARELLGMHIGSRPHAEIEEVLDGYAGDPGEARVNLLREPIKRFFENRNSVEEIVAGLEADGHDFAKETRETLERMSPTSLKLTFEQMRRGRTLDFDDNMKMEYRVVQRVMRGHDFFEGVRALIIDKDKAPRWKPATLGAVSDADVAAYFDTLDATELTLP